MKIVITAKQLEEAGAKCGYFAKFKKQFGDEVELEWTLEKQLEIIQSDDWRGAFGWLIAGQFLPMWSMQGADLEGANLRGATLRGANLRGAEYDENTTWPEGFDYEAATESEADNE
jgi:hypothetical protein